MGADLQPGYRDRVDAQDIFLAACKTSMTNRRITILDLRDSPWVDGPGRTTIESAARIDQQRYRILVAGFGGGRKEDSTYIAEARRRGLSVITIPESGPLDLKLVRRVTELIDIYKVDIVHTHEFRSDVIGLFAARQRSVPVVTTIHGWIANDFKGRIYTALDKSILRFFDHIISVSGKISKELVERGIASSKITTLPNALVMEDYCGDRSDESFRSELGVDGDTLLIANIGRLSPEKGQGDFIAAASAIYQRLGKVRFLLIGVGPEQQRLEEIVDRHGMRGTVIFCGFRRDMQSIYNSLDLVVQSSYTEGMPNVILEAAMMQVPVIATDVGGTSEIVEHGMTGTLVKSGDLQSLAAAMVDWSKNRGKYGEMAKSAHDFVKERFNFEQRTRQLMAVYDQLLIESGRK